MTPQRSISRSVLSDQVKDHLLQAIVDGRYAPGDRIVETRVARDLGTSQAPVREALRDLEALGVVETTAFRGARVRRPSTDELLEGFAIRAELESLGARLAIPRMRQKDIDGLESMITAMRAAADAGDSLAEAAADAEFHGRVIALSGNQTLVRVWRTLEPSSRTYITLAVPGVDRRSVADEHQPILDALRRRDPVEADRAYREHFATTADRLRSAWDAGRPGDPATELDGEQAPATTSGPGPDVVRHASVAPPPEWAARPGREPTPSQDREVTRA
jgi:DNA-binding GntR family transcriptional regulator